MIIYSEITNTLKDKAEDRWDDMMRAGDAGREAEDNLAETQEGGLVFSDSCLEQEDQTLANGS